jgi:hypothetical protein
MIEQKKEFLQIDKDIKNYIKFYKKITNTKFDSNLYHIHHIDENRNNNIIQNLVMLPKKLHHQYHFYKTDNIIEFKTKITSYLDKGNFYNDYQYKCLIRFLNIYGKCCEWNDLKYYFLGYIPNVHNFDIKEFR